MLSENLPSFIHQVHLPWMMTNRHISDVSTKRNSCILIFKKKTKKKKTWKPVCLSWNQTLSPLPRFTVQPHNPPPPPLEQRRSSLVYCGFQKLLFWSTAHSCLLPAGGCRRIGAVPCHCLCVSRRSVEERGGADKGQRWQIWGLYVASLAYRCYRFWAARLNINIALYHQHMAKRCLCAARCFDKQTQCVHTLSS